jgi:ABC-type glutathione transport system ATPase component
MAARLSFAIATEFRPDILLVDEVLSVGDERFRRKCDARINRFWDENSTIVLVSHDMLTIAEHCNRVIWLEQGRVRFDGAAEDAARMYLESIPSVSTFRRGDDLLAHAEAHPRREVLVRAASGGQQLYLVRGGVRHLVGSPAWCERNGYSGEHLLIIDDEVIAQIPEGEVLS